MYPHVTGSASYGFAPAPEFPRLRGWLARASAQPSVARDTADLATFMKESGMDRVQGGEVPAPALQRQYRDHRLEWMMKSGGVEIVLQGIAAGTIKFATGHGE